MLSAEINSLGDSVANQLNEQEKVDRKVAFDPAMIVVILQVIIFIINFFKKKSAKADDVQKQALSTNLVKRVVIKIKMNRYIRDTMTKDQFIKYDVYDDKLIKATLTAISTSDTSEMEKVIASVPSVKSSYLS